MHLLGAVLGTLVELVEAEGRLLRSSILATARSIAWIAFAAIASGCGLALVLYGVYLEGAALARPSVGAFIAGGIALVIAGAAGANIRR